MKFKSKNTATILSALFILFFTTSVCAQTVPVQQEASGVENLRRMEEQGELLRKKIQEEPAPLPVLDVEKPFIPEPPTSERALVASINVSGVTLLSDLEIDEIIMPFQGKELTLREMQKIANIITDAYREKGYSTSRAVLPPQKIQNDILEINVIEGRMGQVEVRGNRYFKTPVILKRISLVGEEFFNYETLRKNLSKLNEFPDRNVKAVLAPGKESGTTDVILEVKDQSPFHFGATWDNYASRFLGKYRYQGTATHNNFLGFDDILTYRYQASEADAYELGAVRYLFPLTEKTNFGLFWAKTEIKLGDEFSALLARGKSKLYSAYVTHELIATRNLLVNLNAGFDYKDIFNFQLGVESSRDRLRIFTTGISVDRSDSKGRTIFNTKIDTGVPDMFGGLSSVDSKSSRAGAGGEFVKSVIDLLRLQNLAWGSTLLLKSQAQFTSRVLPAAEQFQIGGISNVRGYPPGEFIGDYGQSMTGEFTFPPYFLPKVKIPFTNTILYDVTKLALFYDWGRVELRTPQAGEKKHKVLRSAGAGVSFNLPQDFAVRFDFAWPLDDEPSDGDGVHTWFKISKRF